MDTVIFDLDNTLINSESMYFRSLQTILANDYHFVLTKTKFHQVFGIKMKDELKLLGLELYSTEIINEWVRVLHQYRQLITIDQGVPVMLSELHYSGYKIAVASSKTSSEYEATVKSLGITQYFDTVVLATDVLRGKPSPEMLDLAKQRLRSVSKNCMYVGDVKTDLQAAQRARMKFGGACWYQNNFEQLKDADYIFYQPNDLINSFQG